MCYGNGLLLSSSMLHSLMLQPCILHPIQYTRDDDVIKRKHFPRYWPFVRGIHRSQVNSPHKGQWCGALMCSLICARRNVWVNNREAGDLRRHRAHYDVIVMFIVLCSFVVIKTVSVDSCDTRSPIQQGASWKWCQYNISGIWVNSSLESC